MVIIVVIGNLLDPVSIRKGFSSISAVTFGHNPVSGGKNLFDKHTDHSRPQLTHALEESGLS